MCGMMSVNDLFVAVCVFFPIFCAMLFLFATLLFSIQIFSSFDDGLYFICAEFFSFFDSAIPALSKL